jgi:hypothetical protein
MNSQGGLGRREGGCRRLIRDHSVDARKGGLPPPADIPSPLQQLAPPPNYQEAAEQAAQQRREAAPLPPPPLYQQQTQHQQQQLRQCNHSNSLYNMIDLILTPTMSSAPNVQHRGAHAGAAASAQLSSATATGGRKNCQRRGD